MNRIAYLDLIKVYAIFLVILGHSPIWTGFANQLEYSFTMPVFFALYGMTYNIERHASRGFLTLDFFKQRFIRLMIPAIIWAIGYSVVSPFDDSPFRVTNLLYIAYFSQASLKMAGSLTSIWFIPCMFVSVLLTELTMSLIYKSTKNIKQTYSFILVAIVFYALITFLLPRFHRGYPWCVNLVPLATAMIMVGYLVRQLVDRTSIWCSLHRLSIPFIFISSFVILCVVSWVNWQFVTIRNVDMASASFGNPVLYLMGAISGIIMMTAFSVITSPTVLHPVIAFAGANTYGIFLIHKPLIISLGNHLASLGLGNLFTAFLSALFVLVISCMITYVIDILYPPLLGNKSRG